MQRTQKALGLLLAGLMLAIAPGCSRPPTESVPTASQTAQGATVGSLARTEQTPDGRLRMLHVDLPTYPSVGALTRTAGHVLIGTVRGEGAPVNQARDPLNPAREAPDRTMMARVYRVEVEQWLKGDGARQVEVVVPDYTVLNNGHRYTEPYVQLQVGQRYALFLNKGNRYFGVGEPWQFRLGDGLADVRVGTEFGGDLGALKGLSEADLMRQIQQAGR